MNEQRTFSLVRRIIWLVVGVTVVTLLLHAGLLVVVLSPIADELVGRTAINFKMAEAALRGVPDERRDSVASALSVDSMKLTRAAPAVAASPEQGGPSLPGPFVARLAAAMNRPLTYSTFIDPSGKLQYSLALPIDQQVWWGTTPVLRPPFVWTLVPILISAVVIALAALVALVVGIRLITRPMSLLSQEMLSRRNQLRHIDEPDRLSVELRGVIRSFNSLVSAVELSAQSGRELLAGLSHDLRTPLARLRLRAETECDEAIWQRMEPDFSAVGRIIDQFLAYVQGQGGVTIGEMHPLGELVEEVVAQYQVEGSDVRLFSRSAPELMVPDLGTQRALTNLLDNALTYGKAPVEVELKVKDEEAWLTVFDHGRGIAEADLSKALQPFVRLAVTGADSGNCGLGLAIVAQVTRQLGGRTVLYPFDGKRSGLAMCLPLR
jgi:two-component system, OmpR family, osmolarity sensor histidine kinase EnvZ